MSKDDEPTIFVALLSFIVMLALVYSALFFVTILVHIGASDQAHNRCKVRGYQASEVVVHHPFFWSVDTYCYDNPYDKEDTGVKL